MRTMSCALLAGMLAVATAVVAQAPEEAAEAELLGAPVKPRVLGTVVPGVPGEPVGPFELLGVPAGGPGARQAAPDFLDSQLQFERVLRARVDTKFALKDLFRSRGLAYPPVEVFLRVFKQEQIVELWGRSSVVEPFTLVKAYPMCALPGRIGPKRRQGDFQVPEGFYSIRGFNPQSEYHLSLAIDYPNPLDRVRAGGDTPGGDIYIHGGCATVGCVPLEDSSIKELYWLAVEARAAGQQHIPVHIFPTRMSDEGLAWLTRVYSPDAALLEFWKDLQKGFAYFETRRTLPVIGVATVGRYRILDPIEVAELLRLESETDAPGILGTPAAGGVTAIRASDPAPDEDVPEVARPLPAPADSTGG